MRLRFVAPKDATPNGLDGIIIRFPYDVVEEQPGFQKDSITSSHCDVTVSRTLMAMWQLSQMDLLMDVFGHVLKRLDSISGNVDPRLAIEFGISSVEFPRPIFDQLKIPNPDAYEYEWNLNKRQSIGFKKD